MFILERSKLMDACLTDLEETFLAVMGVPLSKMGIDAARVRVSMALLSSEYLVGQLGVPKGVEPKAMTIEQLRIMGIKMNKEVEVEQAIASLKPGSLAHQLWETSKAMPPIQPKVERKAATPRKKIERVKATFNGVTKPRSESLRAKVLRYIQTAPEQPVDVAAIEAALGFPVRGHVQKLIELKHVEVAK